MSVEPRDINTITFQTSWFVDLVQINNFMARPTRYLYRRAEPPHSVSAQVQACSNPTSLPLKSHPIYGLRKFTIILAIIGILLALISLGPYAESIAAGAGFLALSILACAADLVSYATEKVSNPDDDPKWPTKRWMFIDIVLAIILQFTFWGAIVALSWTYYGTNILGAYAALADLLCS